MRSRIAAVLILSALVASACGARLTEEQRAAGIGALARGGGTAQTEIPGKGEVPAGGLGEQAVAGGPGGVAGPVTGAGGAVAPAAPAGGNGGATDVGVTGTQITIATIANVSGIQPGLFKSAHQAMQAFVAYQNSLGGLYGRLLRPLLIDDQTKGTGNKAAVLEACDKAFALVGSMSAFDDGGAEAVDTCGKQKRGLPDITAITTNPARAFAKNVYAVFPNRADYYIIGAPIYIKEKHPDVIEKAAILYLDAGVTRVNGVQRRKALEKIGFEFLVERAVQVVESNYVPYVLEMQNEGVEYVTMVSDYQSIQRLLKAMRQQGWFPDVMDWDSVVYSPKFLEDSEAGPAAEGSLFSLNTAMFEEVAGNPEMQLYFQWLARVAPGARPDYFGLYAWSAGRLFVKAAQAVGPRLTRARFFEELRKIHAWEADGLHAAHDIGNKRASPCFMYAQVEGRKFVRLDPRSGFFCNKGGLMRNPL